MGIIMACVGKVEGERRVFSRIQVSVAVARLVVDVDELCYDAWRDDGHIELAFKPHAIAFCRDGERYMGAVRDVLGKRDLEGVFNHILLLGCQGRNCGLPLGDLHLAGGVGKDGSACSGGIGTDVTDSEVDSGRLSISKVGDSVVESDAVGNDERSADGYQGDVFLVTEVIQSCHGEMH